MKGYRLYRNHTNEYYPYVRLAGAIVKQAIQDFFNDHAPGRCSHVVRFLRSEWGRFLCSFVDVNPDILFDKLYIERERKRNGRKDMHRPRARGL